MRANERLRDVTKIGYLDTPSKNSKVRPELNPIYMDNTDYEVHRYGNRRREAIERERTQKCLKHSHKNIKIIT